MNIDELYNTYLNCNYTVTIDSRNCPQQALFFAIRGENFDGNKYAESALSNGAQFAVVDNTTYYKQEDSRYILVDNTLQALQQLANHHRNQLTIPIIGITGTNGKTTTKELLAACLEKKYNTQYTYGNLNNHIGVPLTLLTIKAQHEIAIIEMGANHLKEIEFLCNIAEPNLGLITNVGKAHLEGFGSFEGVINTKCELYEHLIKKSGPLFVDRDNSILWDKVKEYGKTTSYGTSSEADIIGDIATKELTLSINWHKQSTPQKNYSVQTNLVGSYNLSNLLAAITIGSYFHITPNDLNDAIHAYTPTNNRSQFKQTAHNKLFIDAYNANPTSMMASIKNFIELDQTNKVAILGDMKEMGKESLIEHQIIIDFLAAQHKISKVVLVGAEFGKTEHPFIHFKDVEGLKEFLIKEQFVNQSILIKGSNGIKLSTIIDLL